MKKSILFVLLFTTITAIATAQKGNNQIGIAAEMGFPIGSFDNDFNTGFGASAKGLWGIGKIGQATFTTGYTYYEAKGFLESYHGSSDIIPFLAGFRFNKSGFYAEPQLGFGLYQAKVNGFGLKTSKTDGAFTYAIGVGFVSHGIDAGVRYQGAKKGSDDITIIGLHMGYTISFKK